MQKLASECKTQRSFLHRGTGSGRQRNKNSSSCVLTRTRGVAKGRDPNTEAQLS